jgi:hypothetical protein
MAGVFQLILPFQLELPFEPQQAAGRAFSPRPLSGARGATPLGEGGASRAATPSAGRRRRSGAAE